MKNVMPAFELRDDDKMPIGYKEIGCHMIFDVNMYLTRKRRLVARGNNNDPPNDSTYASLVSRDRVCIAFTVAELNGLDVIFADVHNAYLNSPTSEKNWAKAGLEFGSNAGQPALIVRALYGLKSSGAR